MDPYTVLAPDDPRSIYGSAMAVFGSARQQDHRRTLMLLSSRHPWTASLDVREGLKASLALKGAFSLVERAHELREAPVPALAFVRAPGVTDLAMVRQAVDEVGGPVSIRLALTFTDRRFALDCRAELAQAVWFAVFAGLANGQATVTAAKYVKAKPDLTKVVGGSPF